MKKLNKEQKPIADSSPGSVANAFVGSRILSELLRLRRKELGINQTEAGKLIGVGRSQYTNIEGGRINPSIKALIKLLTYFDITFEELYGLKETERTKSIKQHKIKELKK